MRTKRISVINPYALRTEPVIVANKVDVMPIAAIRAPPLVGAMLPWRINAAATFFAAPTVLASANCVALQMAVLMSRMFLIDITVP